MIQQAKLPFPIPLRQIQKEVANLTAGWQLHFNTRHYSGDWTVLALRSPGGLWEQIVPDARAEQNFLPTALMDQCPNIKATIDSLCCPVMSVRLMKLAPGAEIKEHRDNDLAFEKGEARIHFPIFTHPQVAFFVNKMRVLMQEGDCWYINANLPHSVTNHSPTNRIHLVVDCAVNDWLEDLFAKADIVEAPIVSNDEETYKIIRELRRQNTEAANSLANELERKLGTQG